MKNHCSSPSNSLFRMLIVMIALGTTTTGIAADDDLPLELHEWSVWLGEPQSKQINAATAYPTAMPSLVDSERNRRREVDKQKPSPIGLMTIYGNPPEVVDVDLKITGGRPVSQWPKSEGKASRLRWLDLTLSKELSNPELIAYIPETHWFHQARALGGLYIQLKKGGRAERFFAYDLEFQSGLTVRVDGGPDEYKFANLGKHPLHDILLIIPGKDGVRLGWLDTIAGAPAGAPAGGNNNPAGAQNAAAQPATAKNAPAGAVVLQGGGVGINIVANNAAPANNQPAATPGAAQPAANETLAAITLSEPLAADSEDFKKKTDGELRQRLSKTGLSEAEINLMLSLYAQYFFASDEIQVLYRVSPEGIDEMTPLSVEPDTTKIKRVAMVIARKVDPRLREDVQKLITELGDTNFPVREKAEARLKELGNLASSNLKEAVKSKDLEVVMRAERLLLKLKEQLGADPNAGQ